MTPLKYQYIQYRKMEVFVNEVLVDFNIEQWKFLWMKFWSISVRSSKAQPKQLFLVFANWWLNHVLNFEGQFWARCPTESVFCNCNANNCLWNAYWYENLIHRKIYMKYIALRFVFFFFVFQLFGNTYITPKIFLK